TMVCLLALTPAVAAAGSGSGQSRAAASTAAALTPPGDCPTVKPLSSVAEGQRGIGWTVQHGTTREPFRVKILGVLPNGIIAGRDLIIVKISDVAGKDMIEKAGGIWAGMSGSPVYVNGQLLGSISYGFTAAPSRIGGVTPAEQ